MTTPEEFLAACKAANLQFVEVGRNIAGTTLIRLASNPKVCPVCALANHLLEGHTYTSLAYTAGAEAGFPVTLVETIMDAADEVHSYPDLRKRLLELNR